MKKDDLVKVIRAIVQQELKKELPKALAQVFQNLMKNGTTTASATPQAKKTSNGEVDEEFHLKGQLKEMFNGNASIPKQNYVAPQPQQKRFTTNPVLNEVLNQTRPFNSQERIGAGSAGMSSAVMMASSGMPKSSADFGEAMSEQELEFLNNIPDPPGASSMPPVSHIPTNRPLSEGQEGGPAPLESLGEVTALDLKDHPAVPKSLQAVLNRNYSELVHAMEKKK